jgi:arginine decarboxylase
MLPTPTKYFLTSGSSEGNMALNAFDNALLKAGIGNLNLIKISSILPPKAQFTPGLEIPAGALVPTAYGSIVSTEVGATIAAAIAVGISEDSFGILMELTGKYTKLEVEEKIKKMIEEAFAFRKMPLKDFKVSAVEHIVQNVGCALAAAPLWY